MQHKELESLCLQQAYSLIEANEEISKLKGNIIGLNTCVDHYKNKCEKLQKEKPVTSKWLWFLSGSMAGSLTTGIIIFLITR